MFSSIRWKFVTIYFLLVFIAMSIVGVFIVDKLEAQQIQNILDNMEKHIETIIETSSYVASDNWENYSREIQETLNEWRLGSTETLYIISNEDVPRIIASTSKKYPELLGENALSSKYIDPRILLKAFNGEKADDTVEELNEDITNQHLAYPVISETGQVKGVVYMTSNLVDVHKTVDDSKVILTNATILALSITVLLGFLIASNITTPIRDLTTKVEEMAKGDFDQFVEVKSTDEIGQLASMFNYLTLELKDRIKEIDFERSKLETIFTYMAEGVIAVDRNNKVIHANITSREIIGFADDYIESEDFDYSLLGIEDVDYLNEDSLEGTTEVILRDEIYKVKHAPFKTDSGNIGGIIIVLQDITKEYKLDNMRKEFVANVSHELKTPITTIKSYAETLIESDTDMDTRNKFLGVIDSECNRMNRLVSDLLKLSNLDYKKTKWNKINIDINELIDDIILKLEFSLKEKNHKLEYDCSEKIPMIYADRDGIQQVLINVISNAIKYTDSGGLISIKTGIRDKNIFVEVSDNGMGISSKDLDRIFERFYRVEKGRSRELGGTGLGLSIAREIVESHMGKLEIYSEINEGTKVLLTLPLEQV